MHSLADGAQSEALHIDLPERYPRAFCRIVSSPYCVIVFRVTEVEHIERVDVHARVTVDIGNGEEVLHMADVEARLFLDLADDTLLARLPVINESPGQVECALGGIFGAPCHQQFALAVQDEGRRGRTGVLVIRKPALRAVLALEVIDLEELAPALRTVSEEF